MSAPRWQVQGCDEAGEWTWYGLGAVRSED